MIKIENYGYKKVLVSEKETAEGALGELHHQAHLSYQQSVELDIDDDCTLIIKQRESIFAA